jgi:ribosomal protein S12 methylthiotransferase accessory factor
MDTVASDPYRCDSPDVESLHRTLFAYSERFGVAAGSAAHEVDPVDVCGRKAYRHGTHRTVAPSDMLEWVGRFMPIMGVTRLANVTGLDFMGLPVVMACRPNSRSVAVSQGKGLDLAAAKVSALMEAVEAYHAESITAPLKLATYEELRYTHRLVDPLRLPLCRDTVFHSERRILWIEGRDLISCRDFWVPYELVHTDYTLPAPSGSGCFLASSNGLASGSHLLEAISHALCELVERDAVALWNCLDEPGRRATRIDLDTLRDPDCCDVLAQCRAAEMGIVVFDATSNIGLPTFVCYLMEHNDPPRLLARAAVGSGCHPDPSIAFLRSVTEAVQIRVTYISGARDDLPDHAFGSPDAASIASQRRRLLHTDDPLRPFPSTGGYSGDTFADDVAWALGRLQGVGLDQVIVVDLSKPQQFRVPVVRLVLPGLEGVDDHPLYLPGRRARAVMAEQS